MQNKAFSMEDLFAFLNAGVSAFHSTAAAAAILEAEGYRNCPESAAWHLVPGGKYYTTRNGSAILAWRMPKGPLTGWHAAASAGKLILADPVAVDLYCAGGSCPEAIQAKAILCNQQTPKWLSKAGDTPVYYDAETPTAVVRPGKSVVYEEVQPLAVQ